jgi:hypothetical protein
MRFIKNIVTGVVLHWTPLLERVENMRECTASGSLIEPGMADAEVVAEVPAEAVKVDIKDLGPFSPESDPVAKEPSGPSLDFDTMTRAELMAFAESKGVRVHANAKDDTIRERLRQMAAE